MTHITQLLYLTYTVAVFSTAQATADISADRSQEIEIAGLVLLDNEYSFSIHNTAHNTSRWSQLGRVAFGYTLESFDSNTSELTVSYNGTLQKLTLRNADDTPIECITQTPGATDVVDIFISPQDISPEIPGEQSLHALKSKLRYSIAPRSNPLPQQASGLNSRLNSTQANSNTNTPNADQSQAPATGNQQSSDTLTESELIALSVYEKNYVAVREAPRDVEITYPVSPR
jgi:hypothetical protein